MDDQVALSLLGPKYLKVKRESFRLNLPFATTALEALASKVGTQD